MTTGARGLISVSIDGRKRPRDHDIRAVSAKKTATVKKIAVRVISKQKSQSGELKPNANFHEAPSFKYTEVPYTAASSSCP